MAIPNDSFLNADQEKEVTFLSGFNNQGTLGGIAFSTWNHNQPASYSTISGQFKYGGGTRGANGRPTGPDSAAGTPGGTVTYSIDPSYSAAARSEIATALAIWSDEANVQFQQSIAANPDITFGFTTGLPSSHTTANSANPVGSTDVEAPTGSTIQFSATTFPLIDNFSDGGFSFQEAEHEIGHSLGLGHPGPYDETRTQAEQTQLTPYDQQLYSLLSYLEPSDQTAALYNQYPVRANFGQTSTSSGGNVNDSPTTPMMLDILALQRLYGLPTSQNDPLSTAQTFGFNTTITDATHILFDFSQNTKPVITIYDQASTGNTLDLSGFATASTVSLTPGTFSSTSGLLNNIGIAYGTTISTAIGGSAADTFVGTAKAETFTGGGGGDTFTGGGGADVYKDTAAHLTGSTVTDFINADTINVTDAVAAVYNLSYSGTVLSFSTTPTGAATTMQLQGGTVTGTPQQRIDAAGGVDIYFAAPTAPVVLPAPAAPTLAASSDSGVSNSDDLTNIQNPTFTGAAGAVTASATVTLYDGQAQIGSTTANADGSYSVTATTALTQGTNGITVTQSANGLTSAMSPATTVTLDTTPPAASSVTDTVAQGAGATPINLAAPSDNLTPAGSLAIAAGALPTDGLVTLANGTPVVSGQALTSAQLTGLLFTPAGAAGASSAFTYSVTDGAGNASQGTATLNVGAPNTSPTTTPNTPPATTTTPQPPPATAPDTISIAQQVSYDGSAFAITGTVSAATGVRSVEISAVVDGVATDLGAAAVNANGTFNFSDLIGAGTQGFITATETDGANRTASALANYSLQGGLDQPNKGRAPFVAEQDVYTAGGSATTSVSLFRGDGSASNGASRRTTVMAAGQTFTSDQFDDFKNGGTPETTFVFDPNHGLDTISLFRVDGADHDTLSFSGADFGNSIANVLKNTRQTAGGGSIITDPTSGDMVKLVGVTKQQIAQNQADIAFHA